MGMQEIAEDILKNALKKGADKAEVYFSKSETKNLSTVKEKLERGSSTSDMGFGLRVIIGKRLGFAYSTADRIDKIVDNAIKICKVSKSLECQPTFPNELKSGKTVFDKEILNLAEDEGSEIINRVINMLDHIVKPVEVSLSYGVDSIGIINSEGVFGEDKLTFINLDFEARVKNSTFGSFQYSRKFEIDPEKLGEEVVEHVKNAYKAKPIKIKHEQTLLDPRVFGGLLSYTLLPSFMADNVQKHKSLFEGKINEKILSDRINFVDNGLLKDGWSTCKFDGEGATPKKKCVVKNGILKTFLYDCYTATKDFRETTGNAIRNNFRNIPSVGHTNFLMKGEKGNIESLISEIDKGLYVNSVLGAFLSNHVTGDFSVKLGLGYKIERGELTQPIKDVMLSGNMLKILNDPGLISKETLLCGSPSDIYTYGNAGMVLPGISTNLIVVTV